jgi:signal transduction histidine kinase
VQHHLLRIAREAVNNAVKYARASAIQIVLKTDMDELQLWVIDDGHGFDVEGASALEGHFGIRGMKERARKIAADFRLHSQAGEGTRVELALALPAAKA